MQYHPPTPTTSIFAVEKDGDSRKGYPDAQHPLTKDEAISKLGNPKERHTTRWLTREVVPMAPGDEELCYDSEQSGKLECLQFDARGNYVRGFSVTVELSKLPPKNP